MCPLLLVTIMPVFSVFRYWNILKFLINCAPPSDNHYVSGGDWWIMRLNLESRLGRLCLKRDQGELLGHCKYCHLYPACGKHSERRINLYLRVRGSRSLGKGRVTNSIV